MAPGPDLSIYLFLITAFFSFLYLYRSGLDLGNHSNLFHWVDSGLQHVATFLAWLVPPGGCPAGTIHGGIVDFRRRERGGFVLDWRLRQQLCPRWCHFETKAVLWSSSRAGMRGIKWDLLPLFKGDAHGSRELGRGCNWSLWEVFVYFFLSLLGRAAAS